MDDQLNGAAGEAARQASLRRYGLHGIEQDADYGRVVQFAADLFSAPICAVSIVGETDLWFAARVGIDIRALPRARSFCEMAIGQADPLVVADALADPRFADTELVVGMGVRFYAGVPLVAAGGAALGTLCILDIRPRPDFSSAMLDRLIALAGIVVDLFERRIVQRHAGILVPFAHVAYQALITTDADGRINFWNRGAEALFGYASHEVEGRRVELIVPERFRAAHRAGLARAAGGAPGRITGRPVEVIALRADGTEFPAELALSIWREGGDVGFGAQIQDISDRRAREERLHHLANHDGLTGLLNRNSFRERVEMRLEEAGAATVMVLDLDGFKDINDGLGHAAGDTLLQALALRLAGALGPRELLARLGGDEFAILFDSACDPLMISRRADALLTLMAQPYAVCGHQLHLSGSLGVACAPMHATKADELIVRADLALFRAKSEGGRRHRLFDTGMENQLAANRAFQDELRFAIADHQLEVHFQPQVDLRDGRLIGAEALLRWRHKSRGLLLPKAFLQVLETHALAVEAGCWVLNEACRTLAAWQRTGLPPMRMGVNLFAAQLRAGTLVAEIEGALSRHGLSPDQLEVEITETIALRHDAEELRQIHDLHALGVGIAFDDFGTGFASLSTLKDFPLSRLKLDRSFVQDLGTATHSEAIVKGVLTIGHSLGLNVIAEGIETPGQAALLRSWGCDAGQGYLFGRPMAADAFERAFAADLMRERRAG
jgi:diguanylate cyclase (GGDEF)-like protein/PAS domain S-box-containing protein